MDKIKWCLRQQKGLSSIEPNLNMPKSYLNMAEESIRALENLNESQIWTAATTYYIFYYSLYAIMLRIGFKCEIHSCSIEFMHRYLRMYNKTDIDMIQQAFTNRNDLQYYTDRPVDINSIDTCKTYCKEFFLKSKEILIKIKDADINHIRMMVRADSK